MHNLNTFALYFLIEMFCNMQQHDSKYPAQPHSIIILFVFTNISVTYGISAPEQRNIVKTFLKNIFNVDVEQVLTAVMNEYTDYRQTDDENKILNRDTLLSIFRYAKNVAKNSG